MAGQGPLRAQVRCGDAAEVLATLPDACCDALVSDPPSGTHFMGKEWDGHKGGRDQWIAWLAGIMAEARRCLRPGGYALVWALPRTSHWTGTALEDAGFEMRDQISHLFGSGFPKSHSCLKPAHEVWWLAKAPGALQPLQIDAARVAGAVDAGWNATKGSGPKFTGTTFNGGQERVEEQARFMPNGGGRWPPNTLFSHVGGPDGCQPAGVRRVPSDKRGQGRPRGTFPHSDDAWGNGHRAYTGAETASDGTEAQQEYPCVDGCPIKALDAQAGPRTSGGYPPEGGQRSHVATYGRPNERGAQRFTASTGSASRFFPCFSGVDHNASTRYTGGRGAGVNRCRKLKHGGISVSVTDAGIGSGAKREAANSTANLSTDGCGNRLTARFRRVMRFTTATTTGPTTASRTLNSSRRHGTTTTTSACASITASSMEARSAAARPAESGSPLAPTLFDVPAPITATARSVSPRQSGRGKRRTARSITLSAALIMPRASQPWHRASACIVVPRSRRTMQHASTAHNAAATTHPTGAHIHIPYDLAAQSPRSRFFPTFPGPDPADAVPFRYCSKAPARERRLADGTPTGHPTQKPVALAQWLVTLVCPPGGTVLDPFAGVGSLGVGALRAGCHYLGIEQDAGYAAVAQRRLDEEQERRDGQLALPLGHACG